jgi:hypothetical protein
MGKLGRASPIFVVLQLISIFSDMMLIEGIEDLLHWK